jgi:tetratricopeptide (TPR) repeat protein
VAVYRISGVVICSLVFVFFPLTAPSLQAQDKILEDRSAKRAGPQTASLTKKNSAVKHTTRSMDEEGLRHMDFVELNNLGASLTAESRYSEAIKAFDLALKLEPSSAAAHINLSITYERAGRLTESLDAAEAGVEHAPKDRRALGQLCGVHYLMQNFDRASTCYEKLAELAPAEPNVRAQLGAALIRNGQSERAIEILKQVVFESPLHARAHNSIGFAYFRLKKYGTATEYFKRAVEIDPASALFRFNLGITYALRKNKPGALSQYKFLKKLDPERARKVYQFIYRDHVIQAGPPEK